MQRRSRTMQCYRKIDFLKGKIINFAKPLPLIIRCVIYMSTYINKIILKLLLCILFFIYSDMWIVVYISFLIFYVVTLKLVGNQTDMKIHETIFLKSENSNNSDYYLNNSYLHEFGTLPYNRSIMLFILNRV